MKFGISTWVWVSPLTTEGIAELAPKVKDIGYDQFEVPIEGTEDIDYQRAAAILRDHGLAVSVCAAMGEDRDLIHPDKAIRDNGMAYIKHLVDARRHPRRDQHLRPAVFGGGAYLADDRRRARQRYRSGWSSN